MNKKNRVTSMAVVLFSFLSGAALGADSPSDLRRQIAKAEKDFFTLYNKLNSDRQYDMICKTDRTTGTTMAARVCQPRYVEASQRATSSERIQTAARGGPGVDAVNPGAAVGVSQEEGFRQNMREVLAKSPELQALGQKRDELQARLDAITKK